MPDQSQLVYPSKYDVLSVVVGWGVLKEGGEVASSLQNVIITIYKPEMCINSTLNMEVNWPSQICAGISRLRPIMKTNSYFNFTLMNRLIFRRKR